jgi:molecular chaperone DnaK
LRSPKANVRMERLAFGIDFGTTNSIVAAWGTDIEKQHKTPWAFWADGNRPHPSIVWFGPHLEPIVGRRARENMQSEENSTGHKFIRSIKRDLGKDAEKELVGGKREPAYAIAAEIFKHLKREAEKSPVLGKDKLVDCVVTVPVDFRGQHRRDIRRAVERAGIKLKTFLHEPFAALISQYYDPKTKLRMIRGERIVVFDWGGGTLDVCVAEVSQDASKIYELAHDGIADRAGDDFDRKLMTVLKNRFLKKRGDVKVEDFQLRGSARDRFWINTEDGKIKLSKDAKTIVTVGNFVEILGKPFDLEEKITRNEFEEVIHDEVAAAEACVLRCLERARLTPGLVDRALMVGGTSNVPAVRTAVEQHFGTRVELADQPDAAIARGAAIVAAEGWQLYNVRSIGVKLADDSYFEVLAEGAPLTASKSGSAVFYCTDPRPGSANFFFCEQAVLGDRTYRNLGNVLRVETKPTKKIHRREDLDRIVVDFSVSEDATLLCTALSSSAGKEAGCEIYDLSLGLKID